MTDETETTWTPESLEEFHQYTRAANAEYNPWYYYYCDNYTPEDQPDDAEKATEDAPSYKVGNPMMAVRSYILDDPNHVRRALKLPEGTHIPSYTEWDNLAHVFYTPDGALLEFETCMYKGTFERPDGTTVTLYGEHDTLVAADAKHIELLY